LRSKKSLLILIGKNMAEIKIDGKTYPCEVIDGERFIDGKTADEFMRSLPPETLMRLAQVGKTALKDERDGKQKEFNNYQGELSALEFIEDK
jgi:hypothetical protein